MIENWIPNELQSSRNSYGDPSDTPESNFGVQKLPNWYKHKRKQTSKVTAAVPTARSGQRCTLEERPRRPARPNSTQRLPPQAAPAQAAAAGLQRQRRLLDLDEIHAAERAT